MFIIYLGRVHARLSSLVSVPRPSSRASLLSSTALYCCQRHVPHREDRERRAQEQRRPVPHRGAPRAPRPLAATGQPRPAVRDASSSGSSCARLHAHAPRRGLFSFASTTLILSFYNTGVRGIVVPNVVVGMGLGVGGLAQLLAGMWEFACGNTFGATGGSLFLFSSSFSPFASSKISVAVALPWCIAGRSVYPISGVQAQLHFLICVNLPRDRSSFG